MAVGADRAVMPRFVQFPHPGGEHRARAGAMPWNVGPHKRKFLVSPGRYVEQPDGTDEPTPAELVFWGEWEPPSRTERTWTASGRLPRELHRPYWIVPSGRGYRQNTDPWAWGDRMIYCCCKQTVRGGRPTALQRLGRGSVICFGSTIDHDFCVDTVLVVASAEPWTATDAAEMGLDEAFRVCTADAIVTWQDLGPEASGCAPGESVPFTLYRGATVDDPVDGMFSFVPARRADAGPQAMRFARPAIELPGLVNPASRQSPWGANRPLLPGQASGAWEAIALQVLAADLVLATWLETPPCEGAGGVPGTDRVRC